MNQLEIIVPVKNEEKNIDELARQINDTLVPENITYSIVFIVDKSIDSTLKKAIELKSKYPVIVAEKKGSAGKGFSILEGLELATSDYVAFIDGDLQYPPQYLPEMYRKAVAQDLGVVVANRKTYKSSFIRKLGSRANVYIFGRILLGLKVDIQSGLKLFKREIAEQIDTSLVTPWTIDTPLLLAAKELGYKIGQVNISFENRKHGQSKVGFARTAFCKDN